MKELLEQGFYTLFIIGIYIVLTNYTALYILYFDISPCPPEVYNQKIPISHVWSNFDRGQLPMNMSLGCEWKAEYPGENHASTARACKFYADKWLTRIWTEHPSDARQKGLQLSHCVSCYWSKYPFIEPWVYQVGPDVGYFLKMFSTSAEKAENVDAYPMLKQILTVKPIPNI